MSTDTGQDVPRAADDRAGGPGPLRPLRSRYLLAAALVVVALISAFWWGLTSLAAIDGRADAFARTDVPGELAVDVHPGTWDLYAEGGAAIDDVQVTDASGRTVEVGPADGTTYDRGGRTAEAVGSFEVPRGGSTTYRVTVTGSGEVGEAPTLAVGARDDLSGPAAQRWWILLLVVVNVGAAAALVVVPLVRWRRHRPAA